VTERLVNAFVVFFVVLDPVGMVPVFWALTHRGTPAYRRRMAVWGVGMAAAILLVFAVAGQALLSALGIGVPAFRIAGGILLFLLSIDMIFARQSGLRSTTAREQAEAEHREDVSVFPLAFPLIAGPGAMTTVLLFAERPGEAAFVAMIGVMLAVLALLLGTLLASEYVMRRLGETGANVFSRLLGLVLAALSVQYVVDGIRASFP
jgi:multiple antibiotic resistance protein